MANELERQIEARIKLAGEKRLFEKIIEIGGLKNVKVPSILYKYDETYGLVFNLDYISLNGGRRASFFDVDTGILFKCDEISHNGLGFSGLHINHTAEVYLRDKILFKERRLVGIKTFFLIGTSIFYKADKVKKAIDNYSSGDWEERLVQLSNREYLQETLERYASQIEHKKEERLKKRFGLL